MDAHLHLSGLDGLAAFLYIIVLLGTANMLARRFPDNKLAQTWLYIFTPGATQHNA